MIHVMLAFLDSPLELVIRKTLESNKKRLPVVNWVEDQDLHSVLVDLGVGWELENPEWSQQMIL
jgi:hypothetical protein